MARSRPWVLLLTLLPTGSGCSGASSPSPTPTPSLSPSAPPAAATRIMPLGDSITQANTERNSYRRPLWQALRAEGYAVDFVGSLQDNHLGPPPDPDFDLDHEGHWGWTADEILAELPAWAAAHRPRVVLLHLGTNDVLRGQPLDGTWQELADIVAVLRGVDPAVAVLLAQITPADGPENARIEAFNAGIPDLAARLSRTGSPVVVVDHFTGFDPVADTADGLHPNRAGEEKMAARWREALRELLPRP